MTLINKLGRIWQTKLPQDDPAQTYPLAIALDENDPNKLFFTCGDKRSNYICISDDKGENIIQKTLPCSVHGNEVGRATGDRLIYKTAGCISALRPQELSILRIWAKAGKA